MSSTFRRARGLLTQLGALARRPDWRARQKMAVALGGDPRLAATLSSSSWGDDEIANGGETGAVAILDAAAAAAAIWDEAFSRHRKLARAAQQQL